MGLGSWLTRGGPEHGSADSGMVRLTSWDDVESSSRTLGPVGRDRASGLPGVGHGVDIICTVIAALVPKVVKNLYEPTTPIEVLRTPQVLVNPDPQWHGRSAWQAAVVKDAMWDGNAFADMTREVDRLGYPTRLPLIAPSRVTWDWSTDRGPRRRVYVVGPDPTDPWGETGRVEMDPADMFHVAVNVDSGMRMGRGILHRYQDTLRLMIAVEQATFVVMRDGKPVGVLTVDDDLSTDELRETKAAFVNGVRQDGVVALIKAAFSSVSWNAEDLALIPAREYNLRLAADMTGLSPYLLGVPSESRVYANISNEWTNAIRTTFNRYIEPLNDQLTRCVPSGQWVRFDTDDLERPDAEVRWRNWQIASTIGAMSIAEIRQEERLGPMAPDGTTPPTQDEEDAA